MKTLYLIRHAKSDWSQNVSDFERPLNERGHRDAPKMAEFLFNKGISIDQMISSPAKRAFTTCQYFASQFENTKIITEPDLYMPDISDFIRTINSIQDSENSVALFAHNEGITYFANSLTDENIVNIPTCGIVGFSADCETWKDFMKTPKKFLFFYYPKMEGV